MRAQAVFPEKDPLPGAQKQAAILKGQNFRAAGERHFNVARHIVVPFERMDKAGVAIRNQFVHIVMQITPRTRVGIFHEDEAATGMLAKNSDGSLTQAAAPQRFLDLGGDFVRATTGGAQSQ